jgi:hypothetical protein
VVKIRKKNSRNHPPKKSKGKGREGQWAKPKSKKRKIYIRVASHGWKYGTKNS